MAISNYMVMHFLQSLAFIVFTHVNVREPSQVRAYVFGDAPKPLARSSTVSTCSSGGSRPRRTHRSLALATLDEVTDANDLRLSRVVRQRAPSGFSSSCRAARQYATLSLPLLTRVLLSRTAADLASANYISEPRCNGLLDALPPALLRLNRVAHARRAVAALRRLRDLLEKCGGRGGVSGSGQRDRRRGDAESRATITQASRVVVDTRRGAALR